MTNPTGDAAERDLGNKVLPQADVANEDEGRNAQREKDGCPICGDTRKTPDGSCYSGQCYSCWVESQLWTDPTQKLKDCLLHCRATFVHLFDRHGALSAQRRIEEIDAVIKNL